MLSRLWDMKITDVLLILLSTARATRFVTADSLGEWTLVIPAKKWATQIEGGSIESLPEGEHFTSEEVRELHETTAWVVEPDPDLGPRSKLVSGLDCPFCVGYWLGVLNVAAYALSRRSPTALRAWKLWAGTMSLNYVTGHLSSRMD